MNRSQIHQTLESAVHWSLTALVTFPLLPLRLATLVALIFGGVSLLYFGFAQNRSYSRHEMVTAVCFFALPILYLVEVPFSDNPDYVWRVVQRKMGLLVFPLLFLLNSSSGFRFRVSWYMKVFSLATVLVMLKISGSLLIYGIDSDHLSSGGFAFALRTAAQKVSGLHPTYAGLIIGIAVSYSINLALAEYRQNTIARIALLTISVLGIVFIAVLGARMALLAAALAGAVVIWRSGLNRRTKWLYTGFAAVTILLAGSVIPTLRERFVEMVSIAENSTNVRSMIYSCSLELIKDNWIFGVGVEPLQFYLDICYQQFTVFTAKHYFQYNTHNEFLNVLAAKGVFGLAALLLVFGRLAYIAKTSLPLLAFTIMFGVICLTENLLERQIGVFTLALIGTLLLMHVHQGKPKGGKKNQ